MINTLYGYYLKSGKISTDTREIAPGSIFFALKGPNFDANAFAQQALEKGAGLAVIDNVEYQKGEGYFLVEDVLESLQQLAAFHRSQLDIPIIGLTGSNGKTTTKELINAVLSTRYKVQATKGNLNNHIGVPLTLLSIHPEHEMAIIEMGANHIGEIGQLCAIAKPTHGLITNLGKAHLEGFGSFEGVIRAKGELYDHLIKNSGTVWINSQNEILSNMATKFSKPLFYPAAGDFYHCEFIKASPFVELKTENGKHITTHLIGKYNFDNIAVALCVGKYFNVPEIKANKAIASYMPQNNRSQVVHKDSNTIILDAYNANPSSMALAIENIAQMDAENKVVILGDMNELGAESAQEHEKLGEKIAQLKFSTVYLVGKLIKPALKHLPAAHYYEKKDELVNSLRKTKIENSTILLKASRSIGLEGVVEVI